MHAGSYDAARYIELVHLNALPWQIWAIYITLDFGRQKLPVCEKLPLKMAAFAMAMHPNAPVLELTRFAWT